jgi:hypothetical protein
MISMRRRLLSGLMATALVAGGAIPALAQAKPEQLGTFTAWTAWKANDGYGTICFVSAAPESTSPKQTADGTPINRDPPSFLVLHREKAPAVNPDGTASKDANGAQIFRKVRNEVQTLVGYPMRPTTDSFFHSATVDGKRYAMRSIPDDASTAGTNESEGAWLASTDDEAGFVAALKAGSKLSVVGTSNRSGIELTDTYSLSGFTAAMAAIDKACP